MDKITMTPEEILHAGEVLLEQCKTQLPVLAKKAATGDEDAVRRMAVFTMTVWKTLY